MVEQFLPWAGWGLLAFLAFAGRIRWRNRPDVSYGTALNFFYAMTWYFKDYVDGRQGDAKAAQNEQYNHDQVKKAARELDQDLRSAGVRWYH